MKNLLTTLAKVTTLLAIGVLATLTSCKDDPTPVFDEPTISVTPSSASQAPGGTVTFSIAITAPGKAASVKLNDTEIKSYSSDTEADAFTYDYVVPANATTGTLTFTVTDKQTTAKTGTTTVSLTVGKATVNVESTITASTTWTADKYYLLKGNIYVQSGAELTIEAGTIILGDKVTKGSLIVSRGAKIHAVGTTAKPIVFTSSAPAGFRNYGDWGGVVLLGKAVNNQSTDQTIEGISAATGDNGKYGGADDADNSGELQYARIEFAGIALSTDNELNGLTFGSVGSGTKVDHIQVSFSGDDSYEWFGGAVNTSYMVAYRGWDDEFDTDFGFHGKNQFLASFRDPNVADKSGSNGFESDNDGSGSTKTPLTSAVFSNVTFYGPYVYAALKSGALSGGNASSNYQNGGHIRRNTALQVYNCAFVGMGGPTSASHGIFFDKTNVAAVFKGNYLGRIVGTLETLDNANGYSDLNFTTENYLEASQSTVDLSGKFAGMTGAMDINSPNGLLASGSSLLTGAATVPSGLTQTNYIGAFDATTNWMSGWTNFDPNNTSY